MRKYSYFYEGIYEKKLGIMRRGVAPEKGGSGILCNWWYLTVPFQVLRIYFLTVFSPYLPGTCLGTCISAPYEWHLSEPTLYCFGNHGHF